MDGAGFVRIFWQVMLPLAKPVMATMIIPQFERSRNSFFPPLVLTLSTPNLRTLGVGMYSLPSRQPTSNLWTIYPSTY